MFKKLKRTILKIKRMYYQWMYNYCENNKLKCSNNKKFKESFKWKEKGDIYFRKQENITMKLTR